MTREAAEERVSFNRLMIKHGEEKREGIIVLVITLVSLPQGEGTFRLSLSLCLSSPPLPLSYVGRPLTPQE